MFRCDTWSTFCFVDFRIEYSLAELRNSRSAAQTTENSTRSAHSRCRDPALLRRRKWLDNETHRLESNRFFCVLWKHINHALVPYQPTSLRGFGIALPKKGSPASDEPSKDTKNCGTWETETALGRKFKIRPSCPFAFFYMFCRSRAPSN